MENRVRELLDALYNTIKDAWGLPLSSEKCVIEREKVLDMIEEITNLLPKELAEAKRLVDAGEEYKRMKAREAEDIVKTAREQAKRLVDEQEIYQTAKQKSTEMMENAERISSGLKRAAGEYVDKALREAEEGIANALASTQKVRAGFTNAISVTSEPIEKPEEEIEE